MNENKLKPKDFITIGIFTELIFAVEFACGMLGFIHPYIVASYVVLIPLVGSIPMMLFYTKVEKFGMLTIMSVLIAMIMFVTGMGWLGAPLIIASSKPIIIFDEPTSGLDLAHMKQVADQLKRLKDMGKTVLVVTHDNEFILACCDHAVRLEKGSVTENCPIACIPKGAG